MGLPPPFESISEAFGASILNPDPARASFRHAPGGSPSGIPGTIGIAGPVLSNVGDPPTVKRTLADLVGKFIEDVVDHIADEVAERTMRLMWKRMADLGEKLHQITPDTVQAAVVDGFTRVVRPDSTIHPTSSGIADLCEDDEPRPTGLDDV